MSVRIVIYPMFAAGADETSELLEKIADVMADHHGISDEVQSVILVEQFDDDSFPGEEWVHKIATDENTLQIMLPGATSEALQ